LETSSCPDHETIKDDTCFGCKEDGSITGKEFISPPLSSDKGLAAIRQFCRLANNAAWQVDKCCGFHLHIDVTGQTVESVKRVALAYLLTEQVWHSFVPDSRRDNQYCKSIAWDWERLTTVDNGFYDLAELSDRYHWLNLCSLIRHHTIEIRLHSSTLDAEKVCNWAKAHTRFVDWALSVTAERVHRVLSGSRQEVFLAVAKIIGADLAEFYAERAEQFGTRYEAYKVKTVLESAA
jgi:hypothetical protein